MARSFPGTTSDYLSITNPATALDVTGTALTVSAWIKTTSSGTMALVDKTSGTGAAAIQYALLIAAFVPQGRIGDSSSFDFATSGALTSGVWGHVAMVKNGTGSSGLKAFTNGAVGTPASSARTIQDTAGDFRIGRTLSAGVSAFTGQAAEVAIWNVALTDAEIAALAKGVSPLRVHPKNLAAFFPLWGAAGASAGEPDLSGNGQALTKNGTVGVADHAPVGPYVLL